MTQEEIIEGNKLIAEFLRWVKSTRKVDHGDEFNYSWVNEECWLTPEGHTPTNLYFHTCWEDLMPVVEKICRLVIGDDITYVKYATPRTFGILDEETGQIMVRLNGHPLFKADTLIESTWLSVVDFIKYYNENRERIKK